MVRSFVAKVSNVGGYGPSERPHFFPIERTYQRTSTNVLYLGIYPLYGHYIRVTSHRSVLAFNDARLRLGDVQLARGANKNEVSYWYASHLTITTLLTYQTTLVFVSHPIRVVSSRLNIGKETRQQQKEDNRQWLHIIHINVEQNHFLRTTERIHSTRMILRVCFRVSDATSDWVKFCQ